MARTRTLLFAAGAVAYTGYVALENGAHARISRVKVLEDAYAHGTVNVRDILDDGTVKGHMGHRADVTRLYSSPEAAADALCAHIRDAAEQAVAAVAKAVALVEALHPHVPDPPR